MKNRRFKVENLGPIKGGVIDVKPLTILCGPNNSGKTWLMYAIYGYLSGFPSFGSPVPQLNSWSKILRAEGTVEIDLKKYIKDSFTELTDVFSKGGVMHLDNTFGCDDSIFSKAKFSVELDQQELSDLAISKRLDSRLAIGTRKMDVLRAFKESGSPILRVTLLDAKFTGLKAHLAQILCQFLLDLDQGKNIFLIPAERNGLHLFYKELSSRRTALLHHATQSKIDIAKLIQDVVSSKSKYAKPIADYIDWLNDITGNSAIGSAVGTPWAERLREMVDGRYEVGRDGEIGFTPGVVKRNRAGMPRLGLHAASSTVKSLFGLWFYLRNQAQVGDTIMIDEPELNLHPENQRQLARLIVGVVKSGVRVMVSTHSDYFVREIGNQIVYGALAESQRLSVAMQVGYDDADGLAIEQVGAFMFNDGHISDVLADIKEGLIIETFDQTILRMNEASDSLFVAANGDNHECR